MTPHVGRLLPRLLAAAAFVTAASAAHADIKIGAILSVTGPHLRHACA